MKGIKEMRFFNFVQKIARVASIYRRLFIKGSVTVRFVRNLAKNKNGKKEKTVTNKTNKMDTDKRTRTNGHGQNRQNEHGKNAQKVQNGQNGLKYYIHNCLL